jgi:fructan beta-fructosidase
MGTIARLMLITASLVLAVRRPADAAEDILIADFEGETYAPWSAEGTAFGPGPARGTLPGQMHVGGYEGQGLASSFYGGDGSTGTLTSPPLEIGRDYLRFLIGGGGFAKETALQLLVDDRVVRTATGPNTEPGGSEELATAYWDVRDWKGRTVVLRIIDRATGGWGHINVDQLVQTDTRPNVPEYGPREAAFRVTRRFLVIPIKNGAKKTELTLEVDGKPVRRYSTELAVSPDDVDWYAYFTIEEYRDQPAQVTATRATEEGFALVRQADEVPGAAERYAEPLRPQLRFSQAVGWNNDPNGMVYLDGKWHLFFQHNPVGWNWGNMTWGHAVSYDLVHWKQLPDVLFPGTTARGACFSGGGTVDVRNTAGWKAGDEDVLVVFLTDTGAGESVAYSNDGGRTFTWYEENPVVKHQGRDPKVVWYDYQPGDEPISEAARRLGGHWVMAVYDEHEEYDRNIAFYTSVDLKRWDEQSHLPGYYECPELFRLPLDGDPENTRWVVLAADARYAIGDFDGKSFTPRHAGKHRVHWGKYYASQTFENAPDGRRVQIGWAQIPAPGMPFNQTFSFPHELNLRTTEDGTRLFATPVAEIEQLHRRKYRVGPSDITPGAPVRVPVAGELFDLRASFDLRDATRVGVSIGGNEVAYDAKQQRLLEADLKPVRGQVSLQVLVDRTTLEICGNQGRVYITVPRPERGDIETIQAFSDGGRARLIDLQVSELESIWKDHLAAREGKH